MTDYLAKFRAEQYRKRMSLEKNQNQTFTSEFKVYLHGLLSAVIARGVILGPLERCKIIL